MAIGDKIKMLTSNDFASKSEAEAGTNTDKPMNSARTKEAIIKNLPTSIPASGGNSDTVDNKHASDFVSIANVELTNKNFDDFKQLNQSSRIAFDENPTNAWPNAVGWAATVNYGSSSNVFNQVAYSNYGDIINRGYTGWDGYFDWHKIVRINMDTNIANANFKLPTANTGVYYPRNIAIGTSSTIPTGAVQGDIYVERATGGDRIHSFIGGAWS